METEKKVKIYVQKTSEKTAFPSYMTPGSSGLDLRASIEEPNTRSSVRASIEEPMTLEPFERKLISTGLKLAIPQGYEGQVRPRSGLALKHGITTLNSPGTIDSDYRGEVKVLLINLGSAPVVINSGDRIAQLVIAPVVQAELEEVDELDDTSRGEGWLRPHRGKVINIR